MLREIRQARQDDPARKRRWFQDATFDLYVWQDGHGALVALQLCYDRAHDEGVIGWSLAHGYTHARVDHGRSGAAAPMTPILRAAHPPPYFRVYPRFLAAMLGWEDAELRAALVDRLREYRHHLYGRRRPVRRPRGRRPLR